jgi:mycothiol synthase
MNETLSIPNAPAVPGLVFRRFCGEADYQHIVDIINAEYEADHIDMHMTLKDVVNNYRHLENCDTRKDMLFVETDGQTIGYGRIWWTEQNDGARLYELIGHLHPAWRGKGIGSVAWAAGEARVREIAAMHPRKKPKFYQVASEGTDTTRIALLEKFGYQPVRYGTSMVRDLSEPFPDAPMPSGLEVRPVEPEHLDSIWTATKEAFRDHWGARDPSDEEYRRMMEDKNCRPDLWAVAWEGDQVVSVIHNFINVDENETFHRQRGYTEDICTRREWRKRGIARSLLVRSMKMFKDMGMTETALGVDSQNLSGAFHLYESVGYKKVGQEILFRKPIE